MKQQTTPAERLADLKRKLSLLTFARVQNIVVRPEDGVNGMPGLYHYYHGFAKIPGVDKIIHFRMRSQRNMSTELVPLGIETNQHYMTPPKEGEWIAAHLTANAPTDPELCHECYKWCICQQAEATFAQALLGQHQVMSLEWLSFDTEATPTDKDLVMMLRVLVQRDLAGLLCERSITGKATYTDLKVREVCEEYDDVGFWDEYRELAIETGIFSRIIKKPATTTSTETMSPKPAAVPPEIVPTIEMMPDATDVSTERHSEQMVQSEQVVQSEEPVAA